MFCPFRLNWLPGKLADGRRRDWKQPDRRQRQGFSQLELALAAPQGVDSPRCSPYRSSNVQGTRSIETEFHRPPSLQLHERAHQIMAHIPSFDRAKPGLTPGQLVTTNTTHQRNVIGAARVAPALPPNTLNPHFVALDNS